MIGVINSTTQGMLAKLLATENISVHVGSYKTAMFDVKNRILFLPSWNTDSKQVSDLLIGHEVGHALYTPVDVIDIFRKMCPKCPFSILNIVEDIRIERLIQDRYPGLISSFNAGYVKFLADDRFNLKGRDPNSLGFADRLNLKGKARHQIDISFTAEEEAIYKRCTLAETIEDVYAICIDIYNMIADEKAPKKAPKKEPSVNVGEPDDDEPEDSIAGQVAPDEDSEDSDDEDSIASQGAPDGDDEHDYGDVADELESPTLDALNENLASMQTDYGNSLTVIAPTNDKIIESVTRVKDVLASRISNPQYRTDFLMNPSLFKDWVRFKKETMKNIQFLITEFGRRKAAFQYSRSQVSESGDIDMNRLHSYKYDDHIFKTVSQLADAKSHGMMFFIDYSASMENDIHDVINHTLSLVLFCKAVNIPFQVFGFTTSHIADKNIDVLRKSIPINQLSVCASNIFELLNSDMKKNEYELGCRHLRAQAYKKVFLMGIRSYLSKWERMGATPLNETLICAHVLVKEFRKKHNIQKMNVMFLTDGAPCAMKYGLDDTYSDNIKKSITSIQTKYQMTVCGRVLTLSSDEQHNYATLIENLKITCNCVVVGFFINQETNPIESSAINAIRYSRVAGGYVDKPGNWGTADVVVMSQIKSLKTTKYIFIADGYNYDGYFLLNSRISAITKNVDFTTAIKPDAFSGSEISVVTQNKLATEFKKHNLNRKSNRIILSKFAELIK